MPTIRPVTRADFDQWLPLWEGYNAFYKRTGPTAVSMEVTQMTWARFFDGYEPMHALVAESDGRLVGLTHYLFHRNTIMLGPVCYLQDLFTDPALRGKGVGKALIEAVYEAAQGRRLAARLLAHARDQHDRDAAVRSRRDAFRLRGVSQGALGRRRSVLSTVRSGPATTARRAVRSQSVRSQALSRSATEMRHVWRPAMTSSDTQTRAIAADVRLLYAARGLRGFGDGFAVIILPAYLTAIGYSPLQIGIVATAALLGSSVLTLARRLLRAAPRPAQPAARRRRADRADRAGVSRQRAHRRRARGRVLRHHQSVDRRQRRAGAARARDAGARRRRPRAHRARLRATA